MKIKREHKLRGGLISGRAFEKRSWKMELGRWGWKSGEIKRSWKRINVGEFHASKTFQRKFTIFFIFIFNADASQTYSVLHHTMKEVKKMKQDFMTKSQLEAEMAQHWALFESLARAWHETKNEMFLADANQHAKEAAEIAEALQK